MREHNSYKRPQWMEEHEFWSTKCQRAYIRAAIALDNKDIEAAAIARKQGALYYRRMEEVTPQSKKDEWAANRNKAIQEAIQEAVSETL